MATVTIKAPNSSNNALPVDSGGTGATTAASARTNLDVYSKSEVTSAIAQSTANVPSIIRSGNGGYWSDGLSAFGIESTTGHVAFAPSQDSKGFQIRMDTPDGNSIRIFFSDTTGLLQKYTSSGWVTLKTLY